MKLSKLQKILKSTSEIRFVLPDGTRVPSHFHVSEIGHISRNFIDCGGKLRSEDRINFQLWLAEDYDHVLAPQKLYNIISMSQEKLQLPDAQVEIEYLSPIGDPAADIQTIGKYGLDYDGESLLMTTTQTDCLALQTCIPLAPIASTISRCRPGSGCC